MLISMTKFNYSQICSNLLKDLPQRQKEVLFRRFALSAKISDGGEAKRETLESIGKEFGITRERVRQIEKDAISRLKPEITDKKYQKIFQYFRDYFKKSGDLKKEDSLLLELVGGKKQTGKNQIFFLLNLNEQFERAGETDDFYSLWTINQNSLGAAKRVIGVIYEKLKKIGEPLQFKELAALDSSDPKKLISYLEISKKIQKNSEGFFGLHDWPEINPRGVKDKAYLVFKKENKPLHFTAVAGLIDSALPQTVHNELIKDSRFVLVGRGIYALKEWGYERGYVKDVIFQVLKSAQKPLDKEEILEKVLKQRIVKENTVLLNLSNKNYFLRTSKGNYTIKEA